MCKGCLFDDDADDDEDDDDDDADADDDGDDDEGRPGHQRNALWCSIVHALRRTDGDDATMGLAEIDAMEEAKDVGGMAEGGGFGLVSGIPEVDEQATVALQLLQGLADVEGLKDLGEIHKNEKIELNEMFTHDLTLEEDHGVLQRACPDHPGENREWCMAFRRGHDRQRQHRPAQ